VITRICNVRTKSSVQQTKSKTSDSRYYCAAKAAFFAFAAALFFAFFSAFLLARGSTKLAPGGPEVCPTPELGRADTAPGGRYLPGPASSGEAFARLKFPDPLVACGGRYGAGLRAVASPVTPL